MPVSGSTARFPAVQSAFGEPAPATLTPPPPTRSRSAPAPPPPETLTGRARRVLVRCSLGQFSPDDLSGPGGVCARSRKSHHALKPLNTLCLSGNTSHPSNCFLEHFPVQPNACRVKNIVEDSKISRLICQITCSVGAREKDALIGHCLD